MNNPSRKLGPSELAEVLYNTTRLLADDTAGALSALGLAFAAACHASGLPERSMIEGCKMSYELLAGGMVAVAAAEAAANKGRN
jgi:hypothetical protein